MSQTYRIGTLDFTGSQAILNSPLTISASSLSINVEATAAEIVYENFGSASNDLVWRYWTGGSVRSQFRAKGDGSYTWAPNNGVQMTLSNAGNLLLGTTTDSTSRLDVSGSGRFTDGLTVSGSLKLQPISNKTILIDNLVPNGSYTNLICISSSLGDGFYPIQMPTGPVFSIDADSYGVTMNLRSTNTDQNYFKISSGYDNVLESGLNRALILRQSNGLIVSSSSDNIFKSSIVVEGSGRFTNGLTVTGSFTVITGSNVELQVTNTGVRMGNTGSDAHIASGSFTVSTPPASPGLLPGGISVQGSAVGNDFATVFTVGNYATTAIRNIAAGDWHLGPWNNSPRVVLFNTNTASLCIPTENMVFGGSPNPTGFNESRMLIGVNDKLEYTSTTSYPSASNNYFYINTVFQNGNPGTNIRRPLYIGADSIRFYTGGITTSESFNRDPRMVISENGLVITGSLTVFTGSMEFQVLNTGTKIGNASTDLHTITGSVAITNFITASAALISGSGDSRLRVLGSGSNNPIMTVGGSQGQLLTVTDSLTGSLFSVNNISALPILSVNSDDTVRMGTSNAMGLYTSYRVTTSTTNTEIYKVLTGSYDALYIDYSIRSGSNARVGQFMSMWSGNQVNFTEVSASQFGDTSGFTLGAYISQSFMNISSSATTNGWDVKAIIRSI